MKMPTFMNRRGRDARAPPSAIVAAMNLLIIKMTSLGDVIHMLPALTEAFL